jgi:hypothetical protein
MPEIIPISEEIKIGFKSNLHIIHWSKQKLGIRYDPHINIVEKPQSGLYVTGQLFNL